MATAAASANTSTNPMTRPAMSPDQHSRSMWRRSACAHRAVYLHVLQRLSPSIRMGGWEQAWKSHRCRQFAH